MVQISTIQAKHENEFSSKSIRTINHVRDDVNIRARSSFSAEQKTRGGFKEGRGGFQGFYPLPTQRVPPLELFQKSIFGRPTLKIF